jgi:hypothetical protein
MKLDKTAALTIALMALLALAATACSKGGGASPTATAKAYYDAAKSKDVKGMKNAMSKGSLAMMEGFAKLDNKSLDDLLKDPSGTPTGPFEARNEVITGDTATLEIKNDKGGWEKTPFVKEDGQWKIAIDKAFEQGLNAQTDPATPPADSTTTATNPGSKTGMSGGDTNENAKSGSETDDEDEDNKNDGEHGSH